MEFNATFIVSVISFIIFSIIMNAIFYKPLSNIVTERQKFIDETLQDAKNKTTKSEALLKDKQKKIETTKQEARKIIVEKSDDAKNQKNILTAEAQQKAIQSVDTAKNELAKSESDAQAVLTNDAKNLALQISSKILGKQIS